MADVDRIVSVVKGAAAKHKEPIVFVARVPADAPAPDPDVRRRLGAVLPDLLRFCSSYHAVLEGVGFAAALKRGVLTSLMRPVWRRNVFYVHQDIGGVLLSVGPKERELVAAAFAQARSRGLLTCGPPD
jgi:hypothetical protein